MKNNTSPSNNIFVPSGYLAWFTLNSIATSETPTQIYLIDSDQGFPEQNNTRV